MKRGAIVLVAIPLLLAMISPVAAQMNQKMNHQAEGETKIVEGIKGRLKVTPAMSMLDFYLSDARTEEVITQAKVKATIAMPDGKKVEKELPGMKMGETFSYMNTADFPIKGKYSFDITAEAGKKKATFSFTYEVK